MKKRVVVVCDTDNNLSDGMLARGGALQNNVCQGGGLRNPVMK